MEGRSVTIIGIMGAIALPLLTTVFTEACASEIWTVVAPLPGAIIAWIGRYRQGDITPLGAYKDRE